jgi:hypothetical protein
MSERGVFAVDRAIWEHDYLVDSAPFSRREAWLWLVSEAAWKPHRRRIAGKTFELSRGQLAASTRFIASKWRWSEARVRRFLKGLISEGMVDAKTDAGLTILTISKYDAYQRVSLPSDATRESDTDAAATQQRRKVEGKEDKERDSFIQGDALFPECEQPSTMAKQRKFPWPRDYREQFWTEWPEKRAKKPAIVALERAHAADSAAFIDIIEGIRRYIRTKPPDRDWMLPTTFLNQERWNDEPGTSTTNGHRQPRRTTGADALLAGMARVADRLDGGSEPPGRGHEEIPSGRFEFDA